MNPNPVPTGTAASSATSACSSRRRQSVRLAVACALVAGGAVAAPASATVVSKTADYGLELTHNIDMVVVTGPASAAGKVVDVEVLRGEAVVAQASGPLKLITIKGEQSTVLEVNHGPEGAPEPGDCWDTSTSNDIVREGDHVVATFRESRTRITKVTVDDLHLLDAEGPYYDKASDEVRVPFFLKMADGSEPTGLGGEYRNKDIDFRAGTEVVRKLAANRYELVYEGPGYGVKEGKDGGGVDPTIELLNADHTAMHGHVDPAFDMQAVEGLTRAAGQGPAAGCPAPGPVDGGGGGTPTDTVKPDAPTSLTATAASATQIDLAWTAARDNVGVTKYEILRGGTSVGTSTTTAFSDKALTADTTYTYTVKAHDAAGNVSDASLAATAKTKPADTPPPTPTTPSVSIKNYSAAEGDGRGYTTFTFSVDLSSASKSAVSVRYATASGTAKSGSDYIRKSGTVRIAANETSKEVTVRVVRDRRKEADETFRVKLSAPSGATIKSGAGTGVGTIVNDDGR